MRKLQLRSRKGCRRCKERRRKCDEQRPICGECLRIGFKCHWQAAQTRVDDDKRVIEAAVLFLDHSNVQKANRDTILLNWPKNGTGENIFDHPSMLKASATSVIRGSNEKHVLQYLFEQGHRILRYPVRRVPIAINVNAFRRGYPMAITAPQPIQVQALLCLGAAYLSKIYPQYETMSLQQYNSTLSAFSVVLKNKDKDFPAEWICAVASILSYFQMFAFHSPESRLAMLLGFQALVEARIMKDLSWSRGRVLLEHHIHSLSTNGLFHHNEVLAHRSIDSIDRLLKVLNSAERPLGREIVGVPEDMTIAMYKLSFLNNHDIMTPPWTFELSAVTALVGTWHPQVDMSVSSAQSLLLLARLYHLACLCLVQYLWDRNSSLKDSEISDHVQKASSLVESSSLIEKPINSAAWPLIVLGIFARDASHRCTLRSPIKSLADYAQLEGYRSGLRFLQLVWSNDLGPGVLQQPETLAMVHI